MRWVCKPQRPHYPVKPDDTNATLMAKTGMTLRTAQMARKRGWYTLSRPVDTNPDPGGFTYLHENPLQFAREQVRWALYELGQLHRIDDATIDDFAQDGLLLCWERRHQGTQDWRQYFSSIIQHKTRGLLRKKHWREVSLEDIAHV